MADSDTKEPTTPSEMELQKISSDEVPANNVPEMPEATNEPADSEEKIETAVNHETSETAAQSVNQGENEDNGSPSAETEKDESHLAGTEKDGSPSAETENDKGPEGQVTSGDQTEQNEGPKSQDQVDRTLESCGTPNKSTSEMSDGTQDIDRDVINKDDETIKDNIDASNENDGTSNENCEKQESEIGNVDDEEQGGIADSEKLSSNLRDNSDNLEDATSNSEKDAEPSEQLKDEITAESAIKTDNDKQIIVSVETDNIIGKEDHLTDPTSGTETQESLSSNNEDHTQTLLPDTSDQNSDIDTQNPTSDDGDGIDNVSVKEEDKVDASGAKSDISEPAVSIAKGSDKVVTFEDIQTNLDNESEPPKSPTSTIYRELAASRQSERTTTTATEFVYDENDDFPTPEFYDKALQYTPTPPVPESVKHRQESGLRRTLLSRGESNKSVTFADEVNKEDGEEDMEEQDDGDGGGGDNEGDEEKAGEELAAITDKPSTEEAEEEESVFSTAVSEEKIEEATARSKKKLADSQTVAVDLWGQSSYEIVSMGDVVTKRAAEHFEKGCRLADNGDHCQAILAFDKAINLCPRIVPYYLARGESYLQICDFQSAILNLKKACVLDPDCDKYYSKLAFVYYFYGQTLFNQHLFTEALEAFSRASEMRPEVVGYHTRSVACLAALQRHGECLALVNKRLEMEQDNPDLYIMRARLHELFRNTSLCYYDLKDALALNPDQEEAHMMMKKLEDKAEECRNHSVQLQLQGKLKDALNKITTAIETNPSLAEYHLLRGALHRRLQDYNAAIDDYLLALDKTEHNEQDQVYAESQRQLLLTYNDFAVECFCGKHYEEAIILLNKALKGEKREKGLYINRGDCFFRLNELHFALADYHQSLELDQEDPLIRSRIAAIHNEFGQLDYEEHSYQEAEARFTVAIQHNPRMGSYYIYRAKVRFMLENQSGARQDLLMALHLDPSNDDILSLLPRLFPGKSVGDVMRSKQARAAKLAMDNAVVTASPIRLPEIKRDSVVAQQDDTVNGTAKHVGFASNGTTPHFEPSMPDIRACMSETTFNKVLAKNKKKVSDHVKTLLHDRKTLSNGGPINLAPQPPPRPYEIRGGGWKKGGDDRPQGWRTFSLGMGIMNK